MSLEVKLNDDYIAAMKEKNEVKVSTLRMVKSSLKNYAIDKKLEKVSDDDIVNVLSKQIKQRRDSIEEYNKANRDDLAQKEEVELKILEVYMPSQMGKEELEPLVEKILTSNNLTTKAQMGEAMKAVMAELKGKADGKIINQIVASKLV